MTGEIIMGEKMNENEAETKRESSKKRFKEILILIAICSFPLMVITGCGIGNCIQCSSCGDDNTRVFLFAKGTDNNGVEYTSCVGPAGILGFGINSKCWPTECVSVKKVNDETTLSGCVTYYNTTGCIDKTEVKSNGKYSDSVTCLGIKCVGNEYVENVAETTKSTEQNSCLGVSCGEKKSVESKNYNSTMPRLFPAGCWSSAE